MHSIIITGGSQKKRQQTANRQLGYTIKENPDNLILQPNQQNPSISITKIKQIEKFFKHKPYTGSLNLCLINQAEKLSLPAQNALLKTLEEPPQHSLIVLLTNNHHQLLDTIISRCQIIRLKPKNKLNSNQQKLQKNIFNSIKQLSIPERIGLVAGYAGNKTTAINFCKNQLLFLKPRLPQYKQLIKKLTFSISALNANLNPKLILESLFFSY